MSLEPLLTVKDVATLLGVNADTVYQLVQRGDLPAVDVGAHRLDTRRVAKVTHKTVRFKPSTVQAFIDAREARATRGVLAGQPLDARAHAGDGDGAQLELGQKRQPRPAPTSGPVSLLPGADRYVN